MSSPPKHQHHTQKNRIQKPAKSVRCLSPTPSDCAWWTHDPRSHVTSTMSNAKPDDHTTPSLTSQTPRPDPVPAKPPTVVELRRTSPVVAYPPTPRLAPREGRKGRKVARDDLYYLRKSATFPGGVASALSVKATTAAAQPLARPSDREYPLLRNITPLKLPAIKNPTPVIMPKKEVPAKPQAAATKKPKIRRRRPSEVFNMSFSFSAPSRRRSADRTPQISPRTSISSGSSSPTPTPEKRQRVDSSGANMAIFNLLSHKSATHNTDGYNMGSAPRGPANIWGEESLFCYPFVHTSIEAHPGRPVNLSDVFVPRRDQTPSPPRDPIKSDDKPKPEVDTYHTYLASSQRRNSSPDRDPHPFPLSSSRRRNSSPNPRPSPTTSDFPDYRSQLHHGQSTKEARILGLASTAVPTRKRAATSTHPDQRPISNLPRYPVSGYPSTSLSTSQPRAPERTSDPSMERFLTHIRASQEARAAARQLGKWDAEFAGVDESKNPLARFDLGDKPL
ncbi:hypothetical protein CC86DRAFT_440061 [Ophiobolus disseminans]|uniref:Uncharacterized protein n=1 Tax=Ophiobolus disseminans TaxID=1469910 RepID=A0A6A7A432_9PLEO|nr:hypothetical protein CC86DRAFT_440061 [Ophiobolus disseminans]